MTVVKYRLPGRNDVSEWVVIKEQPAVSVLAITTRREILVVRQFRPAQNGIVSDFPGGILQAEDSTPADGARRELLEETGYQSDNWHYLGMLWPSPHRLRQLEYCYLALEAVEVTSAGGAEAESELSVDRLTPSGFREMVRNDEFGCAVCLGCLAKALLAFPNILDTAG